MKPDRRKGKERRDEETRPVFPEVGFDGGAAERLYTHLHRLEWLGDHSGKNPYPRAAEDVNACLEYMSGN